MSAPSRLRAFLSLTTPAVWVLLLITVLSGIVVFSRPASEHDGMDFWLFAKGHVSTYVPVLEQWNQEHPDAEHQARQLLIDGPALERRLLSGFMSGTPLADLVETERMVAPKTFTGPIEDVGFADLTDRLKQEGLLEQLNAPSIVPWTSRGRIFGIPHDVHPVLLCYRSDIVEEAGIDLSKVETWDEFFTAMKPLMKDNDGDGRPDRYILNFWPTNWQWLELLILQADGSLFDEKEHVAINTERNAHILSTLATWCSGPNRVCVDAPEFNAAGNTLRLRGVVVATLMPDWLAGIWKLDMPDLAGKLRLMKVPAWEKGGRRTSVTGGTMLGIPKVTKDFEKSWALAKRLYLDPEVHAKFFLKTTIIPPVKTSWSHPAFSTPDPYFGGQIAGQMFIAEAGNIPPRPSSPYNIAAMSRVNEVLIALAARADKENISDPAVLMPEARQRLAEAHARVEKAIQRNVFLREPAPGAE